MVGSCSPISMNAKPLIVNVTMFHTPPPISRAWGDSVRAARRPAISPATTVASTPLTPSASAGR